jgi:hypothetical protein
MRTTFYTYFSSAYGTLMLGMFVLSFVTNSNVHIGQFGYYGFPIIALIYACYRLDNDDADQKNASNERATQRELKMTLPPPTWVGRSESNPRFTFLTSRD